MFDETTRRRLQEISRKRNIGEDDLRFVIHVVKKRKRLFQEANPEKPLEHFVKSAARDELGGAVERIFGLFEQKIWSLENRDRIAEMDVAEALNERRMHARKVKKHGAEPETIITHASFLPPEKIADATGVPEEIIRNFLKAHRQYNEPLEEYYKQSDEYAEFINKLAEIFAEEPALFNIYKERRKNVHPKMEEAYRRALEMLFMRGLRPSP